MGCHLIRVEFISTDEKKRKRKVGYIARTRCNILHLGIVCFLITSNIIFSYLSQWKWEAERQCQGLFWRKFAERDEEERLLALRLHSRRPEERKGAKSQEGKRPAGKIEKRASLYWRHKKSWSLKRWRTTLTKNQTLWDNVPQAQEIWECWEHLFIVKRRQSEFMTIIAIWQLRVTLVCNCCDVCWGNVCQHQ